MILIVKIVYMVLLVGPLGFVQVKSSLWSEQQNFMGQILLVLLDGSACAIVFLEIIRSDC